MADLSETAAFPFICEGGLVANRSTFIMQPGQAIQLENFEPDIEGGYRRISGYRKHIEQVVPHTSSTDESVLMVTTFANKILVARGEKIFSSASTNLGRGPLNAIAQGTAMTGSGTITVDSTAGFSSSGTLQIDNEQFTYTGITATTSIPFFIPMTGAGSTIGEAIYSNLAGSTDFASSLPWEIATHFNDTLTLNNGTTLPTLTNSLSTWFSSTLNTGNVPNTCTLGSAGTECTVTAGTSNGSIYQYGPIPNGNMLIATATTLSALHASGSTVPTQNNVGGTSIISNVLGTNDTALTTGGYPNESWYYGLFDYTGSTACCSGTTYSGASYQLYLSAYTEGSGISRYIGSPATGRVPLATGTTTMLGATGVTVYSGVAVVDYVSYYGVKALADYDNMVVLTLRSRGISDLNSGGPNYDVSANTMVFDCSGTYSKVLEDPFASFGLSARTNAGNNYAFKVDMTSTSKEYAPRVLGTSPFDKKREEVPVFVEEAYPNLLLDGYRRGKIRGLQCCLTYLPGARTGNSALTSIGWNMTQWQTPSTPWVVSELQGTDVFRLFKFISISDGSNANREYKVSIANLSFERGEFDILVRDFNDTDARPNVLEKFTRCSMDPTRVSFVGRKIGTSTGEFALNSNYIMLQLGDGVLDGTYTGSLPCGFEGYRFRTYSCSLNPFISYKTKLINIYDLTKSIFYITVYFPKVGFDIILYVPYLTASIIWLFLSSGTLVSLPDLSSIHL